LDQQIANRDRLAERGIENLFPTRAHLDGPAVQTAVNDALGTAIVGDGQLEKDGVALGDGRTRHVEGEGQVATAAESGIAFLGGLNGLD